MNTPRFRLLAAAFAAALASILVAKALNTHPLSVTAPALAAATPARVATPEAPPPAPIVPPVHRPAHPAVVPAPAVAAIATPAPAAEPVPSRALFASAWGRARHPALANFEKWAVRYLASKAGADKSLVQAGVALAQARRAPMQALIQQDPKAAIASAVPMSVRAALPPEIEAQLETRVSARGKLSVKGVLARPGESVAHPVTRSAVIEGKEYHAFVYGRRVNQATKQNVSIQGVAIDGSLAVSDSPVRELEPGEAVDGQNILRPICPVSGENVGPGSPAGVVVGNKVQPLCHLEHAAVYEQALIQAEDNAGPYDVPDDAGDPQATAADGAPGATDVKNRPPVSWTEGPKKVLLIRVDFSDLTGTPITGANTQETTAYLNTLFNGTGGVADFYAQGSYGLTSIVCTTADITPVLRMPSTAAYYAVGDGFDGYNDTLHTDAEAAATSAGFNLSKYDRIGVVFSWLGNIPGSLINYGGLGELQGKDFWTNGESDFRVCAHEIGHTYGLQHCNLWEVTDGNPVSDNGQSFEYADPFGVMGSGNTNINYQFDQWQKTILHWIPDSSVQTITNSGTYRIFRFDHPNADTSQLLALKIVRNSTEDYWIALRQLFTANTTIFNGAYILWGYNSVVQGNLIDFRINDDYANDDSRLLAGLPVGASFHDSEAGIVIKPLAKGGTTPEEYLDVQISFDPTIRWQSTTFSVDQASGNASVILVRTGDPSTAIGVTYTTADGTATSPADYTSRTGTVNWAAGDGSPKTVSIPVSPTARLSGELTFTVGLSNPTGGAGLKTNITTTVYIGASGMRDTSYGAPTLTGGINALARQPDGKFVIAGSFSADAADGVAAGYTRLNADGTPDSTFLNGTGAAGLNAVAIQPDGRILLAGNNSGINGGGFPRIDRLNSDGTIDPNFNPGTGPNAQLRALVVQPDGRILVGGDFNSFNGVTARAIVRLNVDGSVDSTFTGPTFTSSSPHVDAIVLQADGHIAIAGLFTIGGTGHRSGVARLNPDGSLDTNFDPGSGAAVVGSPNSNQEVEAIALQSDGSFVLGGTFSAFNGVARASLARVSSSGVLDSSFNPGADSDVRALLVQPDGKILVGGNFLNLAGIASSGAGRLDAAGSFDSTFAVSGIFSRPVNAFALQADGEILAISKNQPILTRLFSGLGNDVSSVQFTAASANTSAGEGGSVILTATRTGSTTGAISVDYATQIGSASTTRFLPLGGILSWADGDSTIRTITVQLRQDGLFEPAQSLAINLGSLVGGAVLGPNNRALIAIPSDPADSQPPSLTVNSPVDGSSVTINPFTFSGTASDFGLGNDGIVSVTINGQEASGDQTTGSGTVNWSALVTLEQGPNSFMVVATDSAGNTTSVPLNIVCRSAPFISSQPSSVGIFSGNTATLSVLITDSGIDDPTVTYQWYQGQSGNTSNPIAGAVSASFTTPPLSTTTSYWVQITNTNGAPSNSATAIVTVFAPPVISGPPALTTINTGQSTSLSVTIVDTSAGKTAVTYQWYQGATGDISTPVSTDATFITPVLTASTSYWVRVTNIAQFSTDSGTASIYVNQPPSIATQPSGPSFNSGGNTTLAVVPGASGTASPALSYQWFRKNGDIATPVGGNAPTYTTPSLTVSTLYFVRLTNSAGLSTNSAIATAIVNGPPVIGFQPPPKSILGGTTATLITALSNTGTSDPHVSYQWYVGASGDTSHPIAGATAAAYTTPPLTATTSYWVSILNSVGLRTNSNSAVVTVSYPPTIGTPPVGSRIVTGQTRTLNVTVTKTGTTDTMLMYQWYQGDSGDVSKPVGTNAASYTTAPLTQDTSFFVRVTNSARFSTDSGTATVKVDASALANLTPMPITGKWTDAVVVSANPSGTADSAAYVPTTGLYAAASFKNLGAVATGGPFDGQFILEPGHKVLSFTQAKSLAVGAAGSILAKGSLALGKLAASEYTLTLALNPDGKVQENILTDNSYARHFTVANPAYKKLLAPTRMRAFPNLVQSQPGVDLFWTPGDLHATSYTIDMRTKTGSKWSAWSELGTATVNSFRDSTTPVGTIRAYRITATDGMLTSPASAASAAINLKATVAAQALANLTPTSFLIAQHTGATADETLDDERDIYATVTIQNSGTAAVAKTGFAVAVDVDGVRHLTKMSTLVLKQPLAPGASLTLPDFSLGRLENGTHTFAVRVDSAHQVDESDETDNALTRSLTVTATKPNLAGLVDPANGFAQSIIVSNLQNASVDSPILIAFEKVYISVGLTNLGAPLPSDQTFNVTFYLDGLPLPNELPTIPITPGDDNTWILRDLPLDGRAKGVHTLTVKIDSDEDIDESEEGDNLISTHITFK